MDLDLKLYFANRQKVLRSFADDEEIYLGKGFTVSNKRIWENESSKNNLTLNYDIGEFEAKRKNIQIL